MSAILKYSTISEDCVMIEVRMLAGDVLNFF